MPVVTCRSASDTRTPMTSPTSSPQQDPDARSRGAEADPARQRDTGDDADDAPLSLWQMIGSALAAGFGVQSSRNRKRDFKRGRASQFILIGICFTVLFVVGMVTLVGIVMRSSGASG